MTVLLAPIALAVELGRGAWRGWGVVARGLDRGMAGVLWPFERAADGMAATLRTLGRVLRISAIIAMISALLQRVLDPLERAWRRVGVRIASVLARTWWFIRDTLAPVARPVARAARRVGSAVARMYRAIRGVARRVIARVARSLAPARRALARVRALLRRRR